MMHTFLLSKEVVLLSTHFVNEFVLAKYRRLAAELNSCIFDVILVVNRGMGQSHVALPEDINCFFTDSDSLKTLRYRPIAKTMIPGSCHFPLMRFFLDNPSYSHYWFIEYDVEFAGRWSVMMDDCHEHLFDYDFLSSHVERFSNKKNRNWPWWYWHNHAGFPLNDCVKGFNPISRYSSQSLRSLDQYQKQGYSAHSEVLITTCLFHGGMKMGDLGGRGDFVPNGFIDKYYLSAPLQTNGGTMRYRPLYSMEEIQSTHLCNKLFHPLKG